jgi:hypothetical protein
MDDTSLGPPVATAVEAVTNRGIGPSSYWMTTR